MANGFKDIFVYLVIHICLVFYPSLFSFQCFSFHKSLFFVKGAIFRGCVFYLHVSVTKLITIKTITIK